VSPVEHRCGLVGDGVVPVTHHMDKMNGRGRKIIVGIPCLLLGGSELSTLAFVAALMKEGYEIRVCCYHESDSVIVMRFENLGARVDVLGLPRDGVPSLRAVYRNLFRYFHSHRPDGVHVQYFAPGMVPILAARRAGVKHVFATVHAAGPRGYGVRAKGMLRLAACLTDHFFCVSQNAERFWFGSVSRVQEPSQWRKTRHSTIHNGVDVEAIQAAGKGVQRGSFFSDLPADAQVIGIVGRLVQLKGHSTLLHALATVVRKMPQTHLLVVGSGADEARFRQEANALGVADHVLWKGRIEPEVLPQYYHVMDVCAVPSYWEGFGLTAAEAMAAGKPVVGTDVPGLREVIEDQVTGYLVPVDDAPALADKLLRLLSRPQFAREMGQRGQERVGKLFDSGTLEGKWIEAYGALLS
jgi:glycosyltransferase involved in cell wall biosynthesis